MFEQSYPVVLNETLGRLLGAAGVEFEAMNVAMGNTRIAPYSWCVEAHAGLDADIISWDMTMMAARCVACVFLCVCVRLYGRGLSR